MHIPVHLWPKEKILDFMFVNFFYKCSFVDFAPLSLVRPGQINAFLGFPLL